jgi:uncharacterized membrane protein
MFLLAGLTIDWTQMPTYNTIMAVSAGAALMSIVYFARDVLSGETIDHESWAIGFGVPGFILTVTGIHMSLTWPLAKYFPFDNIIFGETSFGFGVLLLAAAFYLWKRGASLFSLTEVPHHLGRKLVPISIFIFGLGLGLIGIMAAGIYFQLFAAPPEEPISGMFAQYPWLEATWMSLMFGGVGLGAVLFPIIARALAAGSPNVALQKVVGYVWWLIGLGFLLFGGLNFFTHIGLIVRTMPKP